MRTDRNVAMKMNGTAAEDDARQPEIRQLHAESGQAIGTDFRMRRVHGEKRQVPSARQRVTFAPARRIDIERRAQPSHQRQRADVIGVLRHSNQLLGGFTHHDASRQRERLTMSRVMVSLRDDDVSGSFCCVVMLPRRASLIRA